jgi:oxygen-dependent protoporphyrinogen oxidase
MSASAYRIAVLGGGISGLSCAYRLLHPQYAPGDPEPLPLNRPLQVTLFEAAPRLGGGIASEWRDGFLIEHGADAFLTQSPVVIELAQELGLADQLIPTQPAFRRSFVQWRGRLHAVPMGWYLMAPRSLAALLTNAVLSPWGKLRAAAEWLLPKAVATASGDESIASFVRRRFGQEVYVRMAEPMLAGIYSADLEALSLAATFPLFRQLEQEHGSVLRGLAKQRSARHASGPRYALFMSFQSGMQALVDRLHAALPPGTVRLAVPVKRIMRARGAARAGWLLETEPTSGTSEPLPFDALCVALPAYQAAAILEETLPDVAVLLSKIRYGSLAVLNLTLPRAAVGHDLQGFGFVVPRAEARGLIGCTFCSQKFSGRAPPDQVLLRAFVGGPDAAALLAGPEEAMVQAAINALVPVLQLQQAPRVLSLRRYARALPHYQVGHPMLCAQVDTLLQGEPTLQLIGNGLRGIGIPDCVKQAQQAAYRLLEIGGTKTK